MVTFQGDTVTGLIHYKEWTRNPTVVSFKSNPEAPVQELTIHNTQAFWIEGLESYQRFVATISMHETRTDRLEENESIPPRIDTVFLKLVLRGDQLDLYTYTDILKERFFIFDRGTNVLSELGYHVFIKDKKVHTVENYKQQLIEQAIKNSVFNSGLGEQINLAFYSKTDLVKIIRRINTNSDASFSTGFEKKQRVRMFAGTGITFTQFTYGGENYVTIDRIDNSGLNQYKEKIETSSLTPLLTTGLDYFFNPVKMRLVFRLELAASSGKSEVTSYDRLSITSDYELKNDYKLSFVQIGLIPQLIYHAYQGNTTGLYLGIGGSYSRFYYPENSMHRTPNKQGSGFNESHNDDYFTMEKRQVGFTARVGAIISRKWDIGVQGFTRTALLYRGIDPGYATIDANTLQLKLTYLFNRE